MIKSLLESNCKCFRKSVLRKNFNLKPETQIEKTQSKNRGINIHQYKEVKREAVANFLQ